VAGTIALRHGDRVVRATEIVGWGEDLDQDGYEEIAARFASDDLRQLFDGQPSGKSTVPVTVEMDVDGNAARAVPATLEIERPVARFAASFRPNPARGAGVLHFTLTQSGFVQAHLYDALGRRVRTLVDERDAKAGNFSVRLDRSVGQKLEAGVYFYRVLASEGELTGRVVLIQ
jgi:hypothetical protein